MLTFEEFYETYSSTVVRECSKQGVEKRDVEDVVQETMVKLWNQFDSLLEGEKNNLHAWLTACVKREAYHRILELEGLHNYGHPRVKERHRFKKSIELTDQFSEDWTSVAASGFHISAESEFLDAHKNDFLWDAVDKLPPMQRDCLTLRYYNELDRDSIADKLGLANAREVENQLMYGKRALKTAFGIKADKATVQVKSTNMCSRGLHEWTEETTGFQKGGKARYCKPCKAAAGRRSRA